jgi:signal transduction histidine kinase
MATTETVPRQFQSWLIFVPIALAVALLVALYSVSESAQARLRQGTTELRASQWREAAMQQFLSLLLDAETGQRGFLLTENSRYLQSYDPIMQQVEKLLDQIGSSYQTVLTPATTVLLRRLRLQAGMKMGEMNASLRLYGESGRPAAVALIDTDMGKKTMDDIRQTANEMRVIEAERFQGLNSTWQRDIFVNRVLMGVGTALNIALLIIAGVLLSRDVRRREAFARELAMQNLELDRTVQERTQTLSSLSSHLQTVSEAEKASLARELHDELGGLLVATKMDVVWLRRKLEDGDVALGERWDRVLRSLEEGVEFKRRVIENLRPTLLDNLGLVAALHWLIEETCQRANLTSHENLPEVIEELAPQASIALFRVAQECITNIMKHAKATDVSIDLDVSERGVHLRIADNGVGIALDRVGVPQSHGLASMRHRVGVMGGELRISRGASGGTVVEVSVPMDNVRADASAEEESA